MKTTGEFLGYLNDLQVKLWIDEEGGLGYSAPKGAITADVLAEMRQRKAEILNLLRQARQSAAPAIQPIDRAGPLPLSFGQQRFWFLDQLEAEKTAYNISLLVEFAGRLDVDVLTRCLTEIAARHESLRTNFSARAGQPEQVIQPKLAVELPVKDISQLPAEAHEAEVLRLAKEQAKQAFNLATDPLWRVVLLRLSHEAHVLVLTIHHIIFDGWSYGVFMAELAALYEAFAQGRPSLLPALSLQYADFAAWQREWLAGDVLEQQLSYWRQQLAGAPQLLNLPTDRPRPAVQTLRGQTIRFTIPAPLTQQLNQLRVKADETLFMLVLAAFKILLWRYSGQTDVVVGSPSANRTRHELEPLIGLFINTLVLRTELSGNLSYRELVSRVREVTLGAVEHQELPFEKLVEALQINRDLSHNPLFQVLFDMQSYTLPVTELAGLTLTPVILGTGAAMFDMTFSIKETEQGLDCLLEYNTDLFETAAIERMIGHFQTLLAAIIAGPNRPIGDLPLLTAAERQQLLVAWNDTQAAYPQDRCIHHLFEAQVETTPEATAVVLPADGATSRLEQSLTYQALNRQANQLAHYLQSLGVGPDTFVGLCAQPSLEMVVGVLGILKAGGAYVPLDPTYPAERLNFMLEDAQPAVILTQAHLVEELSSLQAVLENDAAKIIKLDADRPAIADQPQTNPNSNVGPEHLAYMIYTSGSTGRPKGTLLAHRGLCNLAVFEQRRFDIGPGSRRLQFVSLSFDVATSDIMATLCAGATLCIAPPAVRLPGPKLIKLFQEQAITHVAFPTPVLAALPAAELPDLRVIMVGGEICPPELVAKWSPGRRFFNLYGPTEATITVTTAECVADGQKPFIGRPIANTQIYILDRHLQPVPIGVPGELHIGGVGLARGYLNRPDLTTERFIPNPFGRMKAEGGRMKDEKDSFTLHPSSFILYKTGDLARFRPDGQIEFLGRVDDQVKIRGFRIELGEIEAALRAIAGVDEAVVIVWEGQPPGGDKRLVAYIVATVEIETARERLKEMLPHYMIPAAVMRLAQMPLTPNGKIDHRALPAPDFAPSGKAAAAAPLSPTEKRLAALWAEILGVNRVSRRDSFFDLGGHSLTIVQLMYRVQEIFSVTLPIQKLYETPTLAALAREIDRLREQHSGGLPPCLISLQAEGTQPPLFLVHPVMGVVFPYYDLASQLDRERPVYGLQAVGLAGEGEPLSSVEAIAAHYLEVIQLVQPEGPYFLGGWSFGAHVAFEMAQQLRQAGQTVAQLVIIDTPPISANALDNFLSTLDFVFTSALPSIWPYVFDYFDMLRQQPDGQSLSSLRSFLTPPEVATAEGVKQESGWSRLPAGLRLLRIMQLNIQAAGRYQPRPHPGRITLFRTSQSFGKSGQTPDLGWADLAGTGVEIYYVPGHHLDLLRRPHVKTMADQLRQCLALPYPAAQELPQTEGKAPAAPVHQRQSKYLKGRYPMNLPDTISPGFDLEEAIALAELTRRVHQVTELERGRKIETLAEIVLSDDAWQFVRLISVAETGGRAFVLKKADRPQYVVVFQHSTEQDKNIKAAVYPAVLGEPIPPPVKARVHQGWLATYEALNDDMIQFFSSIEATEFDVYLTGHGSGGCLAALGALRLKRYGQVQPDFPPALFKMVSFGSPRLGNKAFTVYYNRQMRGFSYLVQNLLDGVIRQPAAPFPYNLQLKLHGMPNIATDDGDYIAYEQVGEVYPLGGVGNAKFPLNVPPVVKATLPLPFPHTPAGYRDLLIAARQYHKLIWEPGHQVTQSLEKQWRQLNANFRRPASEASKDDFPAQAS
jgi:amino acid adenylation domain-containing protein